MALILRSPPTTEDILTLSRDVRELDREEWVAASGGKSIIRSLVTSLRYGDNWAVIDEETGLCLAIWGVCAGNAWMIATNEAASRVHEMHRLFKRGIGRMHELYDELEAWAYDKNTLHHEWMLRMGFKDTGRTASFGLPGSTFKLFKRKA